MLGTAGSGAPTCMAKKSAAWTPGLSGSAFRKRAGTPRPAIASRNSGRFVPYHGDDLVKLAEPVLQSRRRFDVRQTEQVETRTRNRTHLVGEMDEGCDGRRHPHLGVLGAERFHGGKQRIQSPIRAGTDKKPLHFQP